MPDQLTIGMIGCGSMMGAHKRGYEALWNAGIRNFRIVACCDIDKARAVAMAEEVASFQGSAPTVYDDVEAMLDGENQMAAVDISTVHREHHTVAIPCFEAGKHVTIEKPLAITMRAGKLMLDAAEKAGTRFQVAENYRRSPEQRAIKWALDGGRIGDVRMILWVDVRERLWYWTWREHRDQAGGGWPLDGGVHFVDLFRYHIGPVRSLSAEVRNYFPYRYEDRETLSGERIQVDVEDTTFANMRFDGDVLGTWISTTAAPGWEFGGRAIYGSEGGIHWDKGLKSRTEELSTEQLVKEFRGQLSDEDSQRLFPNGVTDTVAAELKEFIDACLLGAPIETDGLEGYKAMAICFALYESHTIQAPVELVDIESLKLENYQRDLNEGLGLG